MVRDPTAPGGYRVADLPGMPAPVESGPYDAGASDDARDINVLLSVKKLKDAVATARAWHEQGHG